MRRYTIVLTREPEQEGYIVDVPALPDCHTLGDTLEEAIANAREAIDGWIEVAQKHGETIPEEASPVEEEDPQTLQIDIAA